MLNQSIISKQSGTTRKTILVDEKNSTALSIVMSNTGVDANADGKKIIKAGTPVYGSLEARNTAFTISGSEGEAPAGIILHDVDVTAGNANSQVVIFGTIDLNKLESDAQALITSDVKSALKMIQFVR